MKTEPQDALSVVTREVQELRAEVARLRELINRDRSGMAKALDAIKKEVRGRLWVTEGRGPYEWDDDRYKAEAGEALRAVLLIADDALLASGRLADAALASPPPAGSAPQEPVTELARRAAESSARRTAEIDALPPAEREKAIADWAAKLAGDSVAAGEAEAAALYPPAPAARPEPSIVQQAALAQRDGGRPNVWVGAQPAPSEEAVREAREWCQEHDRKERTPMIIALAALLDATHNAACEKTWKAAKQMLVEHGWHGVAQLFDLERGPAKAAPGGSK